MPVGINQPSNQIKLTNVSLVRLRKGKKRYELACYKNKLLEYRSGTETDLDNVLQVPTVFLSVSKGQTAPSADLAKSFGKDTPVDAIIQEILKKGEVQVGERERKEILERVEREVVDIVSGRLVDPGSKRVYTPGMIQKALDQLTAASGHAGNQMGHQMHQLSLNGKGKGSGAGTPSSNAASANVSGTATPTDGPDGDSKGKAKELPMWTGVLATKSAKSQALEAMKALIAWQPIPVMRARMRLRVTCPTSVLKMPAKSTKAMAVDEEDGHKGEEKAKGTVKDRILGYVEQVEAQDVVGEEWEVVGFVEPGAFKGLSEFVGGETKGRGRVEVLDMAVTHED